MIHFHQRLSLKTRLAILALGLFLICIWTLTFNANRMLYGDMRQVLSEQQFSTVSLVATDVNDALTNRLQAVEKVACEVTPAMMTSPDALQAFMKQHTTFLDLFNAGTFISDAEGTPIADFPVSAGRLGGNVMARDYMVAAIREKKSSIGRPVLGSSLNKPDLSIAAPICDGQGTVLGALVGVTNLGIPSFLDRVTNHSYGKTGGYLIVSRRHRMIVSATDKRRIMEPSPTPGVFPLIDRFLAGYEGSGVGVNPVGIEVLASARSVPVADWYVNAALPTVEAFAPVRALQRRMRVATLIVSLLAGGLTWWIITSQRLNRALQSQVDAKTVELQKNERRFRSFVENANDLIYTLSPMGTLTYVTPNVENLLGYLPDELIGTFFQPLIHPDELTACRTFLREVVSTGEKREGLEYRIRHKNGTWLWFISNAAMVTDITGDPVFLGIGRDINERKQMELALRESEEKHRILLDESTDAVFSLTPEGRYMYVNLAFARNAGRPPGDIIGRTLWDIFPKAEADTRFASLSRACSSGQVEVLEVCFAQPAGDRHFMTTITPIKDAQGATLAVICSAKDVTRLKTTARELREMSAILETQKLELQQVNESLEQRVAARTVELHAERQRLAGIIEGTNAGTWEWNIQTGETVLNERWADMLGYTLKELAPISAATWPRYAHPDDLRTRDELLDRHFRGELPYYECELRLRHRSGSWVWALDRGKVATWTEDGKPLLMLGTQQDISESRRLQEQLHRSQQLESVGRLAGGVAHDFNNKLSVIMGYAQMAMDDLPDTSPVRNYMQEVTRAAEYSRDITSQLLAFSRQQLVAPRRIDANLIIRETMRSLPRLIGEEIQVHFQPGEELWAIRLDPVQIDRIVMNLTVNARDAMPDGGTLTIATRNQSLGEAKAGPGGRPPGDFVLLSFSDTGCGMDDETLRHMFEPFFTTKGVGKGTGLGLATIHGIISQNHGFIDVESQPGKGTTFRILFPRCLEAAQESPPVEAGPDTCHGSLLLVEDDEALRKMTALALERAGYTVTVCATPHQAIQCCEQAAAALDLIITDVVMPGMNARDMMERIKAVRNDLRVLYMSGHSAEIISRKGVLSEQVHFIQKPVNPKELLKQISEILKS